jgi:hypothetical protein
MKACATYQGAMSLHASRNPAALERGNYMRILQAWRLNGVVG